jgi:hypothetical protein
MPGTIFAIITAKPERVNRIPVLEFSQKNSDFFFVGEVLRKKILTTRSTSDS